MKKFNKKLTPSSLLLLLVNLIPIWGVWAAGWNAVEIFMVYCLETVVIGIYNLIKMGITSSVVKTENWNTNTTEPSPVKGYFFLLFFLVHYGFFVAIQLSLFLSVSGVGIKKGIHGTWDFLIHFRNYLSSNSQWLLLSFVVSYGLILLKDFNLNKAYKTASLNLLMFQPYGRIIIQQFTVIVGSLFLEWGSAPVFITVFAAIKIYFEIFLNYGRLFELAQKRQELQSARRQQ